MQSRNFATLLLSAILVFGGGVAAFAQATGDGSPAQRLTVMHSRLDSMRRSLDSAIAAINAKEGGDKKSEKPDADDPATRLRGLVQEVSSISKDVDDIRNKVDRAERYDSREVDRLETSVTDLNNRVQVALQSTASARTADNSSTTTTTTKNVNAPTPDKKKGKLFGIFGRGGGNSKYADLTGTTAPGRDREHFEVATKEVRKGNYDEGRLLFNTIITTYPDSPFLPLSKLAIADTFYLEGSTSSLIQAAQAYQDWLTFFPTATLSDRVMLKMAEAEMRQMGLPDREVPHARKAEQRLKALLQQFPNTTLRPQVEARLHEVQENLAMHEMTVARFYQSRYEHGEGGLKGAQNRLNEIITKYDGTCLYDEALFRQGYLYIQIEEPDEAAKYFTRLVRDYPNSTYVDKAKEELQKIGAPIPEPDPIKKNMQPCEHPSMMQNIMTQISGSAHVTTDNNGVLISKDSKATNDLIDQAAANQGQIKSVTPVPVYQPGRTPQQSPQGAAPQPGTSPVTKPATTTPSTQTTTTPAASVPPSVTGAKP
jgi:outer membrane protein assembly factor BamD